MGLALMADLARIAGRVGQVWATSSAVHSERVIGFVNSFGHRQYADVIHFSTRSTHQLNGFLNKKILAGGNNYQKRPHSRQLLVLRHIRAIKDRLERPGLLSIK